MPFVGGGRVRQTNGRVRLPLPKKKALASARQRLKFVDDGWRVSATHLRTC